MLTPDYWQRVTNMRHSCCSRTSGHTELRIDLLRGGLRFDWGSSFVAQLQPQRWSGYVTARGLSFGRRGDKIEPWSRTSRPRSHLFGFRVS